MISNFKGLLDLKIKTEFTLSGLVKAQVGMLIAAPGIGKSHFALSLSIEAASSLQILGLKSLDQPMKVLFVSSEDSSAILKDRMIEKVASLPPHVVDEINANLDFMVDTVEPIVIPTESSQQEKVAHEAYIKDLEVTLSNYDLVIFDTVTESIGACDEVKHDREIKNTFQRLARNSGASILLVHHINKNEIRGTQDITMASGAGLTSVMRLTKFLITLENKNNELSCRFLKKNYLPTHVKEEFKLEIVDGLMVCPTVYNSRTVGKVKTKKVRKPELSEPKTVNLAGDLIDDSIVEDKKNLRKIL